MQLNRSFKFGDGLFETMRWQSGKIFNLNLHYTRLSNGLKVLGIEPPLGFDASFLESLISDFIQQNKQNANQPNWRVRISCYRAGAGLYSPVDNRMEWSIEASPLKEDIFLLNETGLRLGLYTEVCLSTDILSNLKTTSALPYVMAARYRQNNLELDDCLLLNQHGRIAESIAANVFYRIEDQLFTPKLAEGGVAGTMRAFILKFAEKLDVKVSENLIETEDLEKADEIFLTNAIQGLRWVKQLSWKPEREFSNTCSHFLTDHLNQHLQQLRAEI